MPTAANDSEAPMALTFIGSGIASMSGDVEAVAYELERMGFYGLAARLYHSAMQGMGLAALVEEHTGTRCKDSR